MKKSQDLWEFEDFKKTKKQLKLILTIKFDQKKKFLEKVLRFVGNYFKLKIFFIF